MAEGAAASEINPDHPSAPIFVVGTGRSGTALLQSLLGAHPRIAAPPEMHYFDRIVALRDYWGDMNDDAVLRRVVDATVSKPSLAACGFDVDALVARCRDLPRTYPTVLDVVMHDFAERQGKQRWSDKSPLQGVEKIWESFPDAQVVHIVRDPRDAIASSLSKLNTWNHATIAATHWRRFTRRTIELGVQRAPDNYLRVRYEDLADDAVATMRTVFGFLGEDFDPAYVTDVDRRRNTILRTNLRNERVLQPIDAGRADDSRSLISARDQLRIAAGVNTMLPELGYATESRSVVARGHVLNALALPRVLAATYRQAILPRLQKPARRYEQQLQRREESNAALAAKAERVRTKQGSAGRRGD